MKTILSILLTLCVALSAMGNDERLQQINAIKKSADYVYGEATMATQTEAASLAYETLQKEVLAWSQRDGVKLCVVTAADINRLADTLMTRRATMYRVFAYVKKSDLLAVDAGETPLAQPEDTAAVTSQPKDSLLTDSVRQVIRQRFFGKRQNDALLRLKKAKNFFELKAIMQPLKEEGKILDFGKYSTARQPELCYLIVYDPAGNIRALLGKGEDVRKNLKTGHDDSIRNYRGCGAIWFLLNEE